MRLATVRTPAGGRAVRVEGDRLIDLGLPDLQALLTTPDWRALAAEADEPLDHGPCELAPPIPRPGKIFCVGLNYRGHIEEMGRDIPAYPTLFLKVAETLVGPTDPIAVPPESDAVDWEAELAVVVGSTVRRARGAIADAAIAGFTAFNDVSMRDWQSRTPMWGQGKCWEATSPVGPYLVTPDQLPGEVRPQLDVECVVDGARVQAASTAELVFDPVALIEYISTIVTLNPGDLIATGTPAGVGHAANPPRYLKPGSFVETSIEHLGRLSNPVVAAD